MGQSAGDINASYQTASNARSGDTGAQYGGSFIGSPITIAGNSSGGAIPQIVFVLILIGGYLWWKNRKKSS